MKYRVEITEPAQQDMMELYLYISEILKEPASAERIYFSIREAVLFLNEMPERYAVIDEPWFADLGIRKMPAENYLVFYQVERESALVTVLRVLYNRREWRFLFGDSEKQAGIM